MYMKNIFLYFVHICVCNLVVTNVRILIDFKEAPIIDDNFYPIAQP